MGCNSSTAGSAGAPTKAGKIPGKVVFQYFQGGGRADPIEQMCAHAGQPYEKVTIAAPGQQGQSEFGTGLPQVKAGGKDMAQFGAIMHGLGIKLGYYDPKDWKAARYCDPIVDTWGDVANASAGFLFAPDDKKPEMLEKLVTICCKFNGLIEKGMNHHGGKFAAGNKMTIADFVLASYAGNYVMNDNCPCSAGIKAKLADTPKLKAYIDAREATFPHLARRGPWPAPF